MIGFIIWLICVISYCIWLVWYIMHLRKKKFVKFLFRYNFYRVYENDKYFMLLNLYIDRYVNEKFIEDSVDYSNLYYKYCKKG